MVGCCLFLILVVGLISFGVRLYEFNKLPKIQKDALNSFNMVRDNMSLEDLNSLFNKKGKHVGFGRKSKYRWNFGDSILVKDKNNKIVSYEDYRKNFENWRDYTLKRGIAYIEMEIINGVGCNGIVVGLN